MAITINWEHADGNGDTLTGLGPLPVYLHLGATTATGVPDPYHQLKFITVFEGAPTSLRHVPANQHQTNYRPHIQVGPEPSFYMPASGTVKVYAFNVANGETAVKTLTCTVGTWDNPQEFWVDADLGDDANNGSTKLLAKKTWVGTGVNDGVWNACVKSNGGAGAKRIIKIVAGTTADIAWSASGPAMVLLGSGADVDVPTKVELDGTGRIPEILSNGQRIIGTDSAWTSTTASAGNDWRITDVIANRNTTGSSNVPFSFGLGRSLYSRCEAKGSYGTMFTNAGSPTAGDITHDLVVSECQGLTLTGGNFCVYSGTNHGDVNITWNRVGFIGCHFLHRNSVEHGVRCIGNKTSWRWTTTDWKTVSTSSRDNFRINCSQDTNTRLHRYFYAGHCDFIANQVTTINLAGVDFFADSGNTFENAIVEGCFHSLYGGAQSKLINVSIVNKLSIRNCRMRLINAGVTSNYTMVFCGANRDKQWITRNSMHSLSRANFYFNNVGRTTNLAFKGNICQDSAVGGTGVFTDLNLASDTQIEDNNFQTNGTKIWVNGTGYNNAGWLSLTGESNTQYDPLFVDVANNDMHVGATTGDDYIPDARKLTDVYIDGDYLQVPVSLHDLGAYEKGGVPPTDPGGGLLQRRRLGPGGWFTRRPTASAKELASATTKMRRTLSPLGTRTGSRQVMHA